MEHTPSHAGARPEPPTHPRWGLRLKGRDAVAAALRSQYGIEPSALEPTERGKDFAASVWRVWVGGSAPQYIVKVRPTDAPRNVAAAAARYLADAGVPGIVSPIPSLAGALSAQSGGLSLTLYPFIEGRAAIEMLMSDDSWRALGTFARRLHETALPPDLADVAPRETYRPPEIDTIPRVDAAISDRPSDDASARKVGELWRNHREEILALARRAEDLGEAVRGRSLPLVTCHADMHTGNLIVGDDGALWVIDWDELVLAPKERDLMFAIGGGISTELVDRNATARFLEGYGDVEVDEQALAYYRHAWAIQDVGGYSWRVILDTSASEEQRDAAARILVGLFRPGEIVELARRSSTGAT